MFNREPVPVAFNLIDPGFDNEIDSGECKHLLTPHMSYIDPNKAP
jgi:hypothetical protein